MAYVIEGNCDIIVYTDAAEHHFGLFLQWGELTHSETGNIPEHMWKRPAVGREMFSIFKALERLHNSPQIEAQHSIAIYNDNKVAVQVLDRNGASSYALQTIAHGVLRLNMLIPAHISFFVVSGIFNLADNLSRPALTQKPPTGLPQRETPIGLTTNNAAESSDAATTPTGSKKYCRRRRPNHRRHHQ